MLKVNTKQNPESDGKKRKGSQVGTLLHFTVVKGNLKFHFSKLNLECEVRIGIDKPSGKILVTRNAATKIGNKSHSKFKLSISFFIFNISG